MEEQEHKLLVPGWAGELSPEELSFVKAKLKANRRLRASWGMGRGTGKMNDAKIQKVAMDGVEALNPSPEDLTGLLHDGVENGET